MPPIEFFFLVRKDFSSYNEHVTAIFPDIFSCHVCILLGTIVHAFPTNSALLIKFRLSSDAQNLATKLRRSLQVGAQNVQETCMQRVHVPTELPFCMPPIGGWVPVVVDAPHSCSLQAPLASHGGQQLIHTSLCPFLHVCHPSLPPPPPN